MKKRALIFGITGQDGSYLSEFLLEKDYEIFGAIRRHSTSGNFERIDHISDSLNLEYADLTDAHSIDKIIKTTQPTEIYNLAAQSHVGTSFDIPTLTMDINGRGVFHILETARKYLSDVKIYQASTSEIFGNCVDEDGFQRESTPTKPVSPYGCAKLFAYSLTQHYRRAHNMFVCNGILFNHESPRRGLNFVTSKVIKTAIEIRLRMKDTLELGNIDSYRDFGHAKDYIQAMYMMMQHDQADDFVISTMKTHSIRDLCRYVFDKLSLDYENYIVINPKYVRPEDIDCLKGDSTKARVTLGWQPTYTFESMIDEMMEYWRERILNERRIGNI